jgi:2,4-dienoyl-CoA reductase-like NADH-dependent reductase (Old Yellow Enzyme family)
MKKLFDKTKLLNTELKNRFFRGGLWEGLADAKGHMTQELFNIYEELARGGVGTIITGYAFITENEQPNPRMMGIYNDSFIEEYKKLTDMIHGYGTNVIMQIVYGGSQSNFNTEGRIIWGPSRVENEVTKVIPTEMNKEDIGSLVSAYGDAALRVKKAGFDGVEMHGAHGYLLSQFLCPYYNRRTDEYGGPIENRARIIFEVYKEIRNRVGDDFPVLIKINAEDFMDNGLTTEESLYVSKRLAELGITAIEVSGGNESSVNVLEGNLGPARTKVVVNKERESYFKEYATRLAHEVEIPVILIGGNRHFNVMEDILNNTKIEYFSLARPLTAEPDLISKWAIGDAKKPKCVSCNKCYNTTGHRCIFNI